MTLNTQSINNVYLGKRDSNKGTYHLLQYHSLDVAAVGTCLVENDPRLLALFSSVPLFHENHGLIPFLLATHDLGKYSKSFQEKIRGENNHAGHTSETYELLKENFNDGVIDRYIRSKCRDCNERMIKRFKRSLEMCFESVAGHHGSPVDKGGIQSNSILYNFGDANRRDAVEFLAKLLDLYLPHIQIPEEPNKDIATISWVLAGLSVVSDWIASNNQYFPWKGVEVSLEEYWLGATQCAKHTLSKLGLVPSPVSDLCSTKDLFGFDPRPLQKVVDDLKISIGANLYIIEDSTGSGKTEASLVLAQKLMKAGCGNGFYFALPTMATANAMYGRIAGESKVYDKFYTGDLPVSVVLAHVQTALSEQYQDFLGSFESLYEDTWMYDSHKKALLSSIGIGTIDQVLMGVLPWKHQSLRLFGCARNILIVDEVHAYDSYMNTLLETLLMFMKSCGCSVILLSATIPRALKRKFVACYTNAELPSFDSSYPLLTTVHVGGDVIEVPVPLSLDKYVSVRLIFEKEKIVDEIVQNARLGACVCWVCNTVSDAISSYWLLKEKYSSSVHLFHARFAMGDRLNRESEVLQMFGKDSTPEMRRGHILVATQVVEQSLDLDFDFMVSDLAPIDLIIQRAGRLWRHSRERPNGFNVPEFVIYSPDPRVVCDSTWYSSLFSGGSYVYPEHGKLWRTADILLKMGGFSMPSDARLLIDSVYSEDDGGIPKSLLVHESAARQKNKVSGAHADNISLDLSKAYTRNTVWSSEEPALTREGDRSVSLELWKDLDGSATLWFDGIKNGEYLSRVNVSYRKLLFSDLFLSSEDNGVIKVIFQKDGDVWRPISQVFKSSDVFYSSEEGLVF